jgi:hypothetical protein
VSIGFQVNCFVLVFSESDLGDYMRDRKKTLPNKSVREIGRQIIKQRQSKTK